MSETCRVLYQTNLRNSASLWLSLQRLGLHVICQGLDSAIQIFPAILSRLPTDVWKLYGILRFKIYCVVQETVQIFLSLAVPESFRHHIRTEKSEVRSLCTPYANCGVKSNMKTVFFVSYSDFPLAVFILLSHCSWPRSQIQPTGNPQLMNSRPSLSVDVEQRNSYLLYEEFNTLRTGLLNCLNARSRGLTFRHRASCI